MGRANLLSSTQTLHLGVFVTVGYVTVLQPMLGALRWGFALSSFSANLLILFLWLKYLTKLSDADTRERDLFTFIGMSQDELCKGFIFVVFFFFLKMHETDCSLSCKQTFVYENDVQSDHK